MEEKEYYEINVKCENCKKVSKLKQEKYTKLKTPLFSNYINDVECPFCGFKELTIADDYY